ncbi:MAG: FAD-dependent oxidoreductase [Burkholderiales bacterium]
MALKVAVVGSGPAGFYAAEALLASGRTVEVDLLERLPVPFGLVRYGVAPDHTKLKSVTGEFERIAGLPGFAWHGNVEVGRDVSIEELRGLYHAVILANGCDDEPALGIPGEELDGVHGARSFVGWYNGHPDFARRDYDLAFEETCIVGHGNVAIDICRILAKPLAGLATTDISRAALAKLSGRRLRRIHVIGRRGPLQASFTPRELRELETLDGWQVHVPDLHGAMTADLSGLDPATAGRIRKNLETLSRWQTPPPADARVITIRFLLAPTGVEGSPVTTGLCVEQQRLEGDPPRAIGTGSVERIPCQAVFRSIGYRGRPLPGLPWDQRRGALPNRDGRLIGEDGKTIPGLYASGWIKRGASGIIGTNRADSIATVASLLADAADPLPAAKGGAGLLALLRLRGCRTVDFRDWACIGEQERLRGEHIGASACKFLSVEEMLAALETASPGSGTRTG